MKLLHIGKLKVTFNRFKYTCPVKRKFFTDSFTSWSPRGPWVDVRQFGLRSKLVDYILEIRMEC